jgi:hypothetical protein
MPGIAAVLVAGFKEKDFPAVKARFKSAVSKTCSTPLFCRFRSLRSQESRSGCLHMVLWTRNCD